MVIILLGKKPLKLIEIGPIAAQRVNTAPLLFFQEVQEGLQRLLGGKRGRHFGLVTQ